VSEASKSLSVKVINKEKAPGQVGVRTVEIPNGAKPVKDFGALDSVLDFEDG